VWFCLGDELLAAVLSRFGVNSYATVVWLLAAGCTVFALVWLLNLFNFMDGTDGIAASQALFVSLVMAVWLVPIDTGLAAVAFGLTAASLGFLLWNWPKASIFMGDVGSGFLGFVLAVLLLLAGQQQPLFLLCGLMVMAVFIVDATVTLLVRMATGQAWTQAHCSHAYQRLAKRYGHLRVLQLCWVINLGWLLPLSCLVLSQALAPGVGLLLAYGPLVALAFYCKAGQVQP
jgi:Fuc2NAc and GlcNAc transferase